VLQVVLTRDGVLDVELSHLPVYSEDASGFTEHWSHSASVRVFGVTQFRAAWTTKDGVVDDVFIAGVDGGRIDESGLTGGVAIASMRFSFTDGSECTVAGERAEIFLKKS